MLEYKATEYAVDSVRIGTGIVKSPVFRIDSDSDPDGFKQDIADKYETVTIFPVM